MRKRERLADRHPDEGVAVPGMERGVGVDDDVSRPASDEHPGPSSLDDGHCHRHTPSERARFAAPRSRSGADHVNTERDIPLDNLVNFDSYRRQRAEKLAALDELAGQLRVRLYYGEDDVPVSLWPEGDG